MGFGVTLKKVLKQRGMSIKELSELSGISINTLYSITKRDTQVPDNEIVEKIAAVLEIDKEQLVYQHDKDNLKQDLANIKDIEDKYRRKLCEIIEMLNLTAMSKLLDQAIDMLQSEDNRSVFYNNQRFEENK